MGRAIPLLLALLREKLHDVEQQGKDPAVSENDIFEMLTPYFADANNEQKRFSQFKNLIKQVRDFEVLHATKDQPEYYRIEPILKAKITVQDYEDILEKIKVLQEEQRGKI